MDPASNGAVGLYSRSRDSTNTKTLSAAEHNGDSFPVPDPAHCVVVQAVLFLSSFPLPSWIILTLFPGGIFAPLLRTPPPHRSCLLAVAAAHADSKRAAFSVFCSTGYWLN